MTLAAKWFDPVIGLDVHVVMVPAPPSPIPVPTPLPHPFFGVVFDPLGAAMGAAVGMALGGGGLVLVNGVPAANTGTDVVGYGHSPTSPGVSFAPNDIPKNAGMIVTGSKTVLFGGASQGRLLSMVMTCNYPVNLPTSICLAIPAGAPVFIGGPDSFDILAATTRIIRTKWFSDVLHKHLKPGPRLSKTICFFTGHPVDVMTGEVVTDALDFDMPGLIPIQFERNYWSRSERVGALGPGWSHPFDLCIDERDLDVEVVLPDGRQRVHPRIAAGASIWDDVDRYTLQCRESGYCLTTWDGMSYHFERVLGFRAAFALVRITDRCDNRIVLRYERGLLVEVTDTVGRVLRFSSTPSGRLVGVHFDAMKLDLVRFEYDGEGRLCAAKDALGHALRYRYRGGVLVQETNRNGLSFYFEYDWYHPEGWCVRTWGDGGIYDRRITYDKHRHVTQVEDSRGGRTYYFGNAAGLVDRLLDPTGRETRYEWDASYRKTAEVNGLGGRTEWQYDDRGNVTRERDANGAEKAWTYDDLNMPMRHVDTLGNVWRNEYDLRGKIRRAIDPMGNAFEYEFDRFGELTTCRDPRGNTFSLCYDDLACTKSHRDWNGKLSQFVHDALGRIVSEVDSLGTRTVYQWDTCGRLLMFERSDGARFHLKHDGEGNMLEAMDQMGHTTRFRYAGLNDCIEVMDAAGGVERHHYDTEGALVRVVNQAGEAYCIELDLAGRIIRERRFDGARLEFRHDAAGRCIERINGARQRTRFVHDAVGRVIEHAHHGGARTRYEYDVEGRLIRASNQDADVRMQRDCHGRVIRESVGPHWIDRRYDAAGHCSRVQTSLGSSIEYEVDGDGGTTCVAIESAHAHGRQIVHLAQDANGHEIARAFPGGIRVGWNRGHAGRPLRMDVLIHGKTLESCDYDWSLGGTISAMTRKGFGATRYEHDVRMHLAKAVRPDRSVELRLADAVGNIYRTRDKSDRVYAAGGVIARVNGTRYVHDGDGRLIEKVLRDGSTWRYGWDDMGQLRTVVRPDGTKVELCYDALGRRIAKRVGDVMTTYLWSQDQLIGEVHGDGRAVTWVFAQENAFEPIAKVENGVFFGIVGDHLGTPLMLFDDAGRVAWRAKLDIFGRADVDHAHTECPWRWPGMYHDDEIGLCYNRFRYYDPELGRYISPDPIGLLGGINLYAYVADPLLWIDPWGLIACDKATRQTRALTEQELEHGFGKHAAQIFGRENRLPGDRALFASIVDRVRRSPLTFFSKVGKSDTIAHLARIDGNYVAVHFYRDGDKLGEVATAFIPGQRQLRRIFAAMSRNGP